MVCEFSISFGFFEQNTNFLSCLEDTGCYSRKRRKYATWTCKKCGDVNEFPKFPENPKDCMECRRSNGKECGVHMFGGPFDNELCKGCFIHHDYMLKEIGTPSKIWRMHRELYKRNIIYDLPDKIPDEIAPHLKTEVERLLYKLTARAVNICVVHKYVDEDETDDYKELKEDFDELHKVDIDHRSIKTHHMMKKMNNMITRAFAMFNMLEEFELTTLSEDHLDCLKKFKQIDKYLAEIEDFDERKAEERAKHLEFIKNHPGTVLVKGSHGETYFTNKEENFCTCLGFKYRDECKHLRTGICNKKK